MFNSKIGKIRAVEYNSMMSMMKLLRDRLPSLMVDYGVSKKLCVNILPSYPRDLTKLRMPAIIIRKVDNVQSKVSLDGFIGQYYDVYDNSLTDVKAVRHDICFQFDILAANNAQTMGLESMITEGIFDQILLWEKGYITFYDFIEDVEHPVDVGTLCMIGAPSEVNLSTWRISVQEPTINEHAVLVRQNLALIQTIVPKQDYVDLSLWIKQHITLKIKEDK